MENIDKLVAWLSGYQDYSYAIVFGILIGCGFGLPIPEDVVLVSGGIMSGLGDEEHHLMHLMYMLLISFAGVLMGDGTMYTLGRIFGYRIQKFRPMRAMLPPSRFAKIQKLFNRYGIWVLFIARFLPVLRSPTFLCAGMSRRVSFFKFFLMDGFAALISVPIWVLIGHYGAQNRDNLVKWLSEGKNGILIFTLVAVGTLVIFIWRRSKKEKARKAAQAQLAEKKLKESQTVTANAQVKQTLSSNTEETSATEKTSKGETNSSVEETSNTETNASTEETSNTETNASSGDNSVKHAYKSSPENK